MSKRNPFSVLGLFLAVSCLTSCSPGAVISNPTSVAAQRGPAAALGLVQSQNELMAQDLLISDAQGNKFVQTAVDGEVHPLTPQLVGTHAKAASETGQASPSYSPCAQAVITKATGPDRVMLDEEGYITPVVDQGGRGSCDTFAAAAALESAYLAQYYKMSSDTFTQAYGYPLSLSEEYLLNLKNETHTAYHDSGSATTNLQHLSPFCGGPPAYALPLATDWPYVLSDTDVELMMMQNVPGAPADTTSFVALMNETSSYSTNPNAPAASSSTSSSGPILSLTPSQYGIPMDLLTDLANYSWSNQPASSGYGPETAVYPPQAVHEKAAWAPQKVIDVQLLKASDLAACGNKSLSSFAPVTSATPPSGSAPAACLAALAAPLEQLLSEKHAMAIAINWDIFKMNASVGAYVYNNPTGLDPLSDDHDVLLVGYDRIKQQFRFKNSWGAQWGNNGFGTVTYDLLLRTLGDAVYVDSVRDPALGTVPNGVWRGFWQGKLGGVQGVAVIHHLYGTTTTDTSTPAGIFYGNDGSQTPFNFEQWTRSAAYGSYTAQFTSTDFLFPLPLFSLTMQDGSLNPVAQVTDTLDNAKAGSWSKCSSNNPLYDENTLPGTYAQAAMDSYVLPPCESVAGGAQLWHVAPDWTCPQGGQYAAQIEYTYDGATLKTTRGGCLKTSSEAPQCPAGYVTVDDVLKLSGGDRSTGSSIVAPGQSRVWLDACGVALPILTPGFKVTASDMGCNPSTQDLSKGGCPLPTCAAPKSVFGVAGAVLTLGSPENGVWALPGQDVCVEEAYAAVPKCPADYMLSPSGTDCLVTPPVNLEQPK